MIQKNWTYVFSCWHFATVLGSLWLLLGRIVLFLVYVYILSHAWQFKMYATRFDSIKHFEALKNMGRHRRYCNKLFLVCNVVLVSKIKQKFFCETNLHMKNRFCSMRNCDWEAAMLQEFYVHLDQMNVVPFSILSYCKSCSVHLKLQNMFLSWFPLCLNCIFKQTRSFLNFVFLVIICHKKKCQCLNNAVFLTLISH